jgi:16S rRNA (uracil1498-N3)-methyltransferase
LAIAPTKNNERLEWLVEKAIEIGVHHIIPIHCKHSERPIIKADRLHRVAVSAMKQSLKYFLPELRALTPFEQLVRAGFDGDAFLAHCYTDLPRTYLQQALHAKRNALICIGPEGDFSREEIAIAEKEGFTSVSLGESRLRTETAGIAAVHTFELINQMQP